MDIGFILKQFVTYFVEPFGMVLTLFIFGIIFLYRNQNNLSKIFLTSSLGLLLLFAYPPFSNFLITNLEDRHPVYDYKDKIKYIHVLGSGHNNDPSQSISSQMSDAGIKRVVEGVIIHRRTPNSILIFTGYKGKANISTADINTKFALALGVERKNIISNSKPKDTEEEANFAKSLVGNKPFVLVTSATHMPRSMKLFKSLGLNPISAPTKFYKKNIDSYFEKPGATTLQNTSVAVHEYLGMLWNFIKN